MDVGGSKWKTILNKRITKDWIIKNKIEIKTEKFRKISEINVENAIGKQIQQ